MLEPMRELAGLFRERRVLVTGAAGFVGSNLVRVLAAAGCKPLAIIRPGSRPWRLADIAGQVIFHEADVADEHALESVFAEVRPECVFHLAAPRGCNDAARSEMLRVNIGGAASLIRLVRRYAVRRLVVAGSSLEYAPSAIALAEHGKISPLTWHGATKAAAHLLFRQAALAEDLPVVLLRIFHVYGPWESAHRLGPTAIRAALSGTSLMLTRPGIRRDWVYVGDVCEALLLAGDNGKAGDVFNIGSGVETANEEFITCVESVTGRTVCLAPERMPPRITDTEHRFADPTRAKEVLGWRPRHDLFSGISSTVMWYQANPGAWSVADDRRPDTL